MEKSEERKNELSLKSKYVVFRGKVLEITKDVWGFWRDKSNTIYAFYNIDSSVDPVNRCGVGNISLPYDHVLTDVCKVHDYMYSSPVYQVFHTRKEADLYLYKNIILIGKGKWYKFLAVPFYYLSRIFGRSFWENDNSNT